MTARIAFPTHGCAFQAVFRVITTILRQHQVLRVNTINSNQGFLVELSDIFVENNA